MATASKTGEKPVKPVTKSPPKTAKPKPAAADKPKAVKKTAAPKAAAEKKTVTATKKPVVAAKAKGAALPPEQRRFYVEVAAYYIAERRGFHGGSELEDWTQAEAEIDRLLQEGILKS
jgi:hypothetical protein